MRHQAQKGFRGIFVGILQHQKGYLVYVPITRNIISSYDVVFDEMFSSAVAYTQKTYSEAMDMRLYVTYTTCATSSRDQTGDIITFAKFEEVNLLSETREDVESDDKSGDRSYDNSIMPPLLSIEEPNALDSGDESDDEPMSIEILEGPPGGGGSVLNTHARTPEMDRNPSKFIRPLPSSPTPPFHLLYIWGGGEVLLHLT